MKSRYASPLGVRVPLGVPADLRISLMPSGLTNQYYGLIPQLLLPCLGRVELTYESSVIKYLQNSTRTG